MQRTVRLWLVVAALGWAPGFGLAPQAFAQEEAAIGERPAPPGEEPADATGEETGEAAPTEEAAPPPGPPPLTERRDKFDAARPTSSYLHTLKFVGLLVIFWLWTLTADWVNRSSQTFRLGHRVWNSVIYFPMLGVLLLALLLPAVVGLSLAGVVYLGSFIAFAVHHNKSVEAHQKVFTSDWFRYELATLLGKVGVKMNAERKADYERGPAVDILAIAAADEGANHANLITARQSPGYIAVKELVVDLLARRSDRVMLDYGQAGVDVKHYIDGVWHGADARERETADVMLAVMKQLANLKPSERRAKQTGKFGASYEGHKYMLDLVSQGTQSGERAVISISGGKNSKLMTYSELGMRDKVRETWSSFMAADVGLLVMSSMPEGGLSTLFDVAMHETDRLMRDFILIEDVHDPLPEFENVATSRYDSKKGESPLTLLPKLLLKYPNVIVCRDFATPESAKALIDQVDEERLVITTVRSRDAAEALLRLLQQKVPHREFANAVTAVLATRLIRKLCDACKVGYAPSADLLGKLKIPADKVSQFYRVPKGEEAEKPCPTCNGLGYLGRTGLFELLVVSDKLREVLLKQPKIELVKKAAQLGGMRSFQEEAILLVAKGTTSLEEVQRVLKQ